MKSIYLKTQLLMVIVLSPLLLFGQPSFIPVLSEGKAWEVATINLENLNDTTCFYNISVGGDTIVNNLTCKKIVIAPLDDQQNRRTYVAYEECGKVWNVKKKRRDGSVF